MILQYYSKGKLDPRHTEGLNDYEGIILGEKLLFYGSTIWKWLKYKSDPLDLIRWLWCTQREPYNKHYDKVLKPLTP